MVQVAARERLKAIGLMVLATICFAFLDSTAKYLVGTESVPVMQVRGSASPGMSSSARSCCGRSPSSPRYAPSAPSMQIFRSVLMIVTTGFNFVALRYLQLDQTIAIFFLTPLLVALLAGPLLNEWVGWHRMVAIIVGFIGVLIVMHPGIGTLHWAMLFVLIATLGYALYNIPTRYLADYDPAEVTQTYTPLAGAVLLAAFRLCRLGDAAGRADLGCSARHWACGAGSATGS